jgi:hypothetical protein
VKSKRYFAVGIILLIASPFDALFSLIYFEPQESLKGPFDFEGIIQIYGFRIYLFLTLLLTGVGFVIKGWFGSRIEFP